MDRFTRAVTRLWGSTGNGALPPVARFAEQLQDHCKADLAMHVPGISKWTFGHQLEHLYRTSHYVLDRLEESLAGGHRNERMGFWGVGLMVGGFIPRHAFPTIPQLEPHSGTFEHIIPLRDSLHERLRTIDWGMADVHASPGKSKHPRMKWLTSGQWMYFADIHHRHHLSIMQDISKAASL